jgi:two-component system nitrogen regulation response regulator GlnG
MPRLLVIDDRDQTIEMIQRRLPQLDTVNRCGKSIPCLVCEERARGCTLRSAHDWAEAEAALAGQGQLPDLVVLDLHFALPEERLLPEDKSDLPNGKSRAAALEALRRRQGLFILERLRARFPQLPVILLTSTAEELGAQERDPLVYFCENEVVDSRTLASEITRALALQSEAQEGEVFWGKSRAMAELRGQMALLARSPLPVLIEGETGCGKSFLAEQVLHPRSGAKGPLVITDLSTVPAALLPAHLVGARRGAYTGATEDHAGVFEQAHGGTLFLDEIGNLELDLQRQLLLVLERGAVTRLGDARPRPAQPRLIAATNQNLQELVAQGRFRHDLYMRLNPAARLRIPPLRERREDLPELVRFALLGALRSEGLRALVRQYLSRFPTPDDFNEAMSAVIIGRPSAKSAPPGAFAIFLSRESLARLVAHAWPGNLRELRLFAVNALVSALAQALDSGLVHAGEDAKEQAQRAPAVLQLSDALIAKLLASERARGARARAPKARGEGRAVEVAIAAGRSFAEVAAEVERQYLRALFELHAGDLSAMAEELLGPGAPARKLHLRLNQLGLKVRDLRGEET